MCETVRKIGLSELKLCVIECIDLFIKSMTWQTLIGGVKLAFYASSRQYVYSYKIGGREGLNDFIFISLFFITKNNSFGTKIQLDFTMDKV